jgi:ABC-type multidrug transport system fused ATPase/permease subunit
MTEEKDRRIRYALLWSFRLLKKYRLGFEIAILSGIILSAINLATVIYIEQAVEQITHKENNIIMIGTILLCLFVAGTMLTYMTEYISGKIGSCVARDVRDTFTDKIMRINQKSKDQLNSGDMISRFNYDLGIITDFIPGGITNFVYQMVMAVTAIVYMLYINWLLLVISIAIVPVCMIIVNILRKRISDSFKENMKNIGQKQMISIARAFLKNAPIVLLDESTSALDAQSEAVVTESLDRLIQDKGVIIVSHRLSSIIKADRILVLNNGKVVEEGNHEALIEWNSVYKKLYLSGFKDKEELRL